MFPGVQPLSVAVDPSDERRLYCATYDRGLWRSEDGGGTWIPAGTPQDYFSPAIGGTIDTRKTTIVAMVPGRLYAALGDGVITCGHSFAESQDDGESWQYVGRGLEAMPYLYGLVLNPAHPDDMRVAASSSPRAAHGTGGASIFRREGDGWVEDAAGFPTDGLIPVLAADPASPGGWFALSDQGLFGKASGSEQWCLLTARPEWVGVHPTTLTVLSGQLAGEMLA